MNGTVKKPLILASASPRRRELLALLGTPFSCAVSGADEHVFDAAVLPPAELVQRLAGQKAKAVASLLKKPSVVIGADTIVVLEGRILGKPADEADARSMLRLLAGCSHEVYTGLYVLETDTQKIVSAAERTTVHFGPMTEGEICAYVATGEPMDKAGAYAIQGKCAPYIERIEGCYYNVMGLPLFRLRQLLADFDC